MLPFFFFFLTYFLFIKMSTEVMEFLFFFLSFKFLFVSKKPTEALAFLWLFSLKKKVFINENAYSSTGFCFSSSFVLILIRQQWQYLLATCINKHLEVFFPPARTYVLTDCCVLHTHPCEAQARTKNLYEGTTVQ